jgi:hypothetical protein
MTKPEWPQQYGDTRVKTFISAHCNNSVLVRHAHLGDPALWRGFDSTEPPTPRTERLRFQLGFPTAGWGEHLRRAGAFAKAVKFPQVHNVADGIMGNETLQRMSLLSMKAGKELDPEDSSESQVRSRLWDT